MLVSIYCNIYHLQNNYYTLILIFNINVENRGTFYLCRTVCLQWSTKGRCVNKESGDPRSPLFCDANILHFFPYKRKVVERPWQHSSHLWFCDTLGLLFLGVGPTVSGHLIFSCSADLRPLSGRWKPWRNATSRKQIHYSSCQTFIRWMIIGRKYFKMSFFFPVK